MESSMNTKLGEMGFDSSLYNDLDSQLTSQEYKERIINLVQPILDERFPGDLQKRRISHHIYRISVACPYCGYSM